MRTPKDEHEPRATLDDVVADEAFRRRPSRAPDFEAENRALVALAEALANEPEALVDRLVSITLELCRADTCGVSILRPGPGGGAFEWVAIAGLFAPYAGGAIPRAASPCGVTIDRDAPLFLERPGRHYAYLADFEPSVVEALLVPLRVAGAPAGTVWVVSHHERRRFDPEDLRLVTRVSAFASAALTRLAETAALREARERIDATLTAAEVGTWTWDVTNDVVVADRNLARIFGVDERDVSGGPIAAYLGRVVPDDRARLSESISAAIDGGDDFESEYRVVGDDGALRWVAARGRVERDAEGSPVRLPGIVVDVSSLKDREREVRRLAAEVDRQRRTFDAALSFISDMVFIYGDDARYRYANRPLLDLLGRRLEDVVGRHPLDLGYPREIAARIDEDVRRVVATGEEVRGETAHAGADGATRYYEYILRPVVGADGAIDAVAGSARDVTERRGAEIERERQLVRERGARAAAEEESRQKGRFLADVSHELRSPLGAILGWAAVLKDPAADEEQAATALDVIERSARAQTRLVEDLLDVSRLDEGTLRLELRACAPSVFVVSAVDALLPVAEAKGVDVVTRVDPDAPAVVADPVRLHQVVWNLLSNAIKFTPSGGRVAVAARRAGDALEVSVEDTGAGIGAEFLPVVFERFAQADRENAARDGGLGLGLSIVRRIVELHGGTVAAESEGEGRGARFAVRLPPAP